MKRGYSLVVVMMTLGLMTVSIFSLWAFLNSAVSATRDSIDQRRVFYVCDGMTRMVGLLIGDYASTTSAPSKSDAYAFVTAPQRGGANLVNVAPDGYVVSDLHIDELALVGDNVRVPNGPYQGLLAREVAMRFSLTARRTDGEVACKIDKTLALSQIGMFSFGLLGVFDDELTLIAGGDLKVGGRLHSNSSICFSSENGSQQWFDYVTAVGQITYPASKTCARQYGTGALGAISISTQGANPVSLAPPDAHDFAAIDASNDSASAGWAATSQATWDGRVKNLAHSVGKLTLPVSKWVQPVPYAEGTAGAIQHGQLRPLIDPPFATESNGDKQNKLAYQADLRIIDGVWYLRDPVNPSNWPGTPIWSDHPGHTDDVVDTAFSTRVDVLAPGARKVHVGQDDLPGSAGARKYSYYEYDNVAHEIADGGTGGVVSYGSVMKDKILGYWVPAVASDPAAGTSPTGLGDRFCSDDTFCKMHPMDITAAVTSDDLVYATDHRWFDLPSRQLRRMMNFDVAQLQLALAAGGSELGSHFNAGRPFNGIVWISSLFPHAWDAPHLDVNVAGTPIPADMKHDGLPQALCSDSLGGGSEPLSTKVNIDDCTFFQPAGMPYVNMVRIINAAQVNGPTGAYTPVVPVGTLPHGLTIATNLPLVVLGDVNVTSRPAATAADAADDEAAGVPWVPVLLAGDTVELLSSAWDDSEYEFNERINHIDTNGGGPVAVPTTYNTAIITGMATSSAGTDAAFECVLRTAELWHATPLIVHGSVVIGHSPVYSTNGNKCSANSAGTNLKPDLIELLYDHRMGRIDRQPPGALLFSIEAVRNWQRR